MILRADNLTVRYGGVPVLDRVSFAVESGDYVGIVGPNGSGKTTLARALLGLAEISAGSVELFGRPLRRFDAWRRVGYLPQLARFHTHRFPARVEEIVATGLLPCKRFPRWFNRRDMRKVEETMDFLGIDDLRGRLFEHLSGGQRQRVFLARALISDPELLVLDEPVAALDPAARERFYEILQKLNRDRRVTVLMISHDMATMHAYAATLLYLDRRVVFFGAPKAFCEADAMRAYFGDALQHSICGQHHGNNSNVTTD